VPTTTPHHTRRGSLIVTEFMTLDGVAQAPGGQEEDPTEDFHHGGWQWPVADPEEGEVMFEQASTIDALLLGRKTYDIFASYWPTAPDSPFTELLNRIPKYVATRTLTEPLTWEGSSIVTDLVALKERHDEIQVIGSLDLVQTLLRLGLVDRLNLWVYPLLLGSGKKVFASGTVPAALRLTDSTIYPGGTAHLTYEIAGVPTYAEMPVDPIEQPQKG
jgi:dihydrofolate reductase